MYHVWGEFIRKQKPDQGYMPMSPAEYEQAERVFTNILAALRYAKARKPAHVRPVEPGGR